MTRLPDWRPRLHAYLADAARKEFAYGAHDCGMFAAGAVEAVTGSDPGAIYRGQYTTRSKGVRRLRKQGHADHAALAASLFPEVHPSALRPGDLAEVPGATDDLPSLGVVQGAQIAVLTESGFGFIPLSHAVRGFHV